MAKGVTQVSDMFGANTEVQDKDLDHENRPIDYGITAADRKRLQELHFETMTAKKVESELTILQALSALPALRKALGQD